MKVDASALVYERVNSPLTKKSEMEKVAVEFEALFLSEMLKSAKFGESRDAFGGGIGEDQYSSFLRNEQAKQIAKQGGIGVADMIMERFRAEKNA
ncbi:MAG: rod-binding protein [Mangrovicoccus sp.]